MPKRRRRGEEGGGGIGCFLEPFSRRERNSRREEMQEELQLGRAMGETAAIKQAGRGRMQTRESHGRTATITRTRPVTSVIFPRFLCVGINSARTRFPRHIRCLVECPAFHLHRLMEFDPPSGSQDHLRPNHSETRVKTRKEIIFNGNPLIHGLRRILVGH